jgi:hypothetical protein
VDIKPVLQDSVVGFSNARRAVIADPGFKLELIPSPPWIGGPIQIIEQRVIERMAP